MKNTLNLLLALFLGIAIISCGHDDDDNNDTPQREEDTTGSNGTTGTSGTSGTTGTTTSCLSSRQRENIRAFLIRASDLKTFTGTGTEMIRQDDGTQTVSQITAVLVYQQASENAWTLTAGICSVGPQSTCLERQTVITFKNGCLNVNGARARNVMATDSSLSYTYFDVRTVRDRSSLATGKLIYSETESKNGVTVRKFNFMEN